MPYFIYALQAKRFWTFADELSIFNSLTHVATNNFLDVVRQTAINPKNQAIATSIFLFRIFRG